MRSHLSIVLLLLAIGVASHAGAQTPPEVVPGSSPSPTATCEAGLVEKYGQEYLTRVHPGFRFTLFDRTYPIADGETPGDVCARAVADQELLASKDARVREAEAKVVKAEIRASNLKSALDRELRPNVFKENYVFYVVGFFVLLVAILIKPIYSFLFFLWRVLSSISLGWKWQKSGGKWSRRVGGTLSSRSRTRSLTSF
jgi:hypothetical protein